MNHIKCSIINRVIVIHDTTLAVLYKNMITAEQIVAKQYLK